MDDLNLKKVKTDSFDIEKCIFCQNNDTEESLSSTPEGREAIINAANVRKDRIYYILQNSDNHEFVYHTQKYQCYKKYTRKRDLEKLKTPDTNQSEITPQESRSKKSRHTPSSSNIPQSGRYYSNICDMMELKCVVCNAAKRKGVYQKYRICEENKARDFLTATTHLQDDVFDRTCDLSDHSAVFGADIFYHKICYVTYIHKYKTEVQRAKSDQSEKKKSVDIILEMIHSEIHPKLQQGKGVTLSSIRDKINSSNKCTVSNKQIKIYLFQRYGSEINFVTPKEQCKSTIVYLKSEVVMEDVIETMSSTNSIKECAATLRESILQVDFGLTDRFMDANELKESWNNINIPEPIRSFLSVLLNCDLNENVNDDIHVGKSVSPDKQRKACALFQVMAYIVNNGEQKPPLHIMTSQSIHETCRSKTLIESFSRLGLGVSYDEMLRYHSNMAKFIATIPNDHIIPLPSHFNKDQYTTAALDNFDHEENTLSGKQGTHDTVSVLFQNESFIQPTKPKISESGIESGTRSFNIELPCQIRQDFIKPAKKPELPHYYKVCESNDKTSAENLRKRCNGIDKAWILSRLNTDKPTDPSIEHQKVPSWSAFNSLLSEEKLLVKIVGFLPVLPFPVTEYSSVYTAMKNFNDVLSQLTQKYLPVACDEGVYCMVRAIQFYRPHEFNKIIPILGSFHMEKILIGVIGKFLAGSGAELILIEAGIFGPNVAKSALAGKHYVRGTKGIQLLNEAMKRLQWTEFFKTHDIGLYEKEKKLLKELQDRTYDEDRDSTKQILQELTPESKLLTDFDEFCEKGKATNETFLFWSRFMEMADLLSNLIRADRLGDWMLHLDTVSNILPYFQAFDSTNYVRWATVYLEDMLRLPDTAPEVHNKFLDGEFVVKRTPGTFRATAMDMALEQTINRSQKSAGGIIGTTKRKQAVTEWQIIYHEMLAVAQVFRDITGSQSSQNSELSLHHEFTTRETDKMNDNVNSIISYVLDHENPFQPSEEKLHNILTQEIMPQEVRSDILEAYSKGKEQHSKWREDVLIKKETPLMDTIKRMNLKTFKNAENATSVTTTKRVQKKKQQQSATQGTKTLDIARSRSYDMQKLFQYDIIDKNYLFEENGLMVKSEKHVLVQELEKKYLTSSDYSTPHDWNEQKTATIVDTMSYARKVSTTKETTFGSLCNTIIKMVDCNAANATRIDYIFDSYIDGSVKDSERSRRAKFSPIEINNLTSTTPLPNNMDYFWPSGKNKTKLQQLLRRHIEEHGASTNPDVDYVVSGTIQHKNAASTKVGPKPDLCVDLEEADQRIIPHIIDCTTDSYNRVVVLSPDSDVFVLLLHYMSTFMYHGLKELFMRAGVGNTTRYIPIHTITSRAGSTICRLLPALHALTGSDLTSKVGTKTSAIQKSDISLLEGFGEDPNMEVYQNAEKFLCNVLKPSGNFETMDQIRYWEYHHTKASLLTLPPTSRSLKHHLDRSFYSTYIQTNLLHPQAIRSIDPQEYGFEREDNMLVPITGLELEPDDLLRECHCLKCATVKCSCRSQSTPCIEYCSCHTKMGAKCKNPMNIALSNALSAVVT